VSHDDPELAEVIDALERAGVAAEVWDADWRVAHLTREYVTMAGRPGDAPAIPVCELD
jgi:hypothetical protein